MKEGGRAVAFASFGTLRVPGDGVCAVSSTTYGVRIPPEKTETWALLADCSHATWYKPLAVFTMCLCVHQFVCYNKYIRLRKEMG